MQSHFLSLILTIVANLALSVISNAADLEVSEFGAVGDGKTDDGPAITAAFAAAKAIDGPSTVIFEKKTYRLGDNPTARKEPLNEEGIVIRSLPMGHGRRGVTGARKLT